MRAFVSVEQGISDSITSYLFDFSPCWPICDEFFLFSHEGMLHLIGNGVRKG